MPTSDATVSEKVQGEQQSDSVYDFLYCDSRRIASFLAQFDPSGHLERVVQKEAAAKTAKAGVEFAVGGGGSLFGHGASGNIAVKRGPSDSGSEASERTYDPLWVNALTFMDFAEERRLIQRDVSSARIGQMVLIKGTLSIFDFGMLRKAWELPTMRKALAGASRPEAAAPPASRKDRRIAASNKLKTTSTSEMEVVADLLGILPHVIQASAKGIEGTSWSTLRDEWMTVPAADLLLKHGTSVPGEWGVIGILDALPDPPDMQIEGFSSRVVENALAGAALNQLGFAFGGALVPIIRGLLGRPEGSYGVTPLMIFRDVKA